ncbi:MAG: VWA domain-containing protein [Bryobacterales bacterium]|nr:VWA domain-containing protein [Bryobacterales bacterium]
MNEFRLHQVELLHLLWLAPLLAWLFYRAAAKRKQALARFAAAGMLAKIGKAADGSRRRWKQIVFLAGLVLVILACARPAWNLIPQRVTRQGRDIVFLIDVSRSMLAQDLRPNRLERAKLAVLDALARLQGDRVALVAFAGTASVKCPLTLDYGFFRMALEDLTTESVPLGGSLIGDGIRKALSDVYDNKSSQFRDIVLITDGEDQESFPVEAAREAAKRGIRLIAIGLGDENVGRRIPVEEPNGETTFLQYKGQEVWSRLDAATLRQMVAVTPGGQYFNVATGAIDFGDIYQQLITGAARREVDEMTIARYEEKFQFFLALGFVLLCCEPLIRERKA